MKQVFISHSTKDYELAKELKDHLEGHGTSVFMAPSSIPPGAKWNNEILTRLRESSVVLLVATKDSCESKFVNQEIGGSLAMDKKLVPILCGITPEELPGWAKEFQAVEMKEDRASVRAALKSIADKLKIDRLIGFLLFISLIWVIVRLCKKKN